MLALFCDVFIRVCHFPIGILGQVWYLIVSIADLCTLSYFDRQIRKYRVTMTHNFSDGLYYCMSMIYNTDKIC